jgi:predicted GNAT superfamily acetyltransferase
MNDHPQSYLVTTSMEEPVLNQCSAAFHRALGFNRVGEFAVAEFQGLTPYRCGVHLKECTRG